MATVSDASHLELGVFYLLCGTSAGVPIPPQVVQVITKPTSVSLLEAPTFEVWMWLNAGPDLPRIGPERTQMSLYDVNIPEHGQHDRHLRRVPDDLVKAMERLAALKFYQDIATDVSMYRMRNGT